MGKPSVKLKSLEGTVINTKTFEEFKGILRVFNCGGWMLGDFDKSVEPSKEYSRFTERMEKLQEFGVRESDVCLEAGPLYDNHNGVIHLGERYFYRGKDIISPSEFYGIQEDVTDSKIKWINNFFEQRESQVQDILELPKKREKSKQVKIHRGVIIDFNDGIYQESCMEIERIRAAILNNPLSKRFYKIENGLKVDLSKLNPGWISDEEFETGHRNFVFGCQDVMLEYGGGLLLVVRDSVPAKGVLWPIGGNYKKGSIPGVSLAKKVKEECNLEIDGEPIYLGEGRTAFQTDPWDHGHGTDTTNERHFARAKGELKLNDLHKDPVIVRPEDYTPEFREDLEQYVQDFIDLSMVFVEGMNPVLLYSYLKEALLKGK